MPEPDELRAFYLCQDNRRSQIHDEVSQEIYLSAAGEQPEEGSIFTGRPSASNILFIPPGLAQFFKPGDEYEVIYRRRGPAPAVFATQRTNGEDTQEGASDGTSGATKEPERAPEGGGPSPGSVG